MLSLRKRWRSGTRLLEPHAETAFSAVVLLVRMYSCRDNVAYVQLLAWMVSLLVFALSRVTLPEFLAVNQELILLAATVVPPLLRTK